MDKRLLKLSLITFIISVVFLVLAFFSFHYLTDAGISTIWHAEAEKPYVTELLGDFGIINLATSLITLLIYLIYAKKPN